MDQTDFQLLPPEEQIAEAIKVVRKVASRTGFLYGPISLIQRNFLLGFGQAKDIVEELIRREILFEKQERIAYFLPRY